MAEVWSFIECVPAKSQTAEETIAKEIEKRIGIKVSHPTFLSTNQIGEENQHYYSAELTDKNVNEITRQEHQLVNFFSYREVDKLNLTKSAKLLWLTHKDRLNAPQIH